MDNMAQWFATWQPLVLSSCLLISHIYYLWVNNLLLSPAGNITLFSFDKGEGLSEHSAPFDALVQVLEGSANIVVNGQVFTVNAGESIVFPANAPHALTAIERFKMLLTMIKE